MTGSFKPGEQIPYPIWTHEYGKLVGAPGFDPGRLQQSAVPVYKTEPHASADAVIGRSGRKRTGDLFVPAVVLWFGNLRCILLAGTAIICDFALRLMETVLENKRYAGSCVPGCYRHRPQSPLL